jgi:phosphohistidine swiveling domain-containing protein
MYARIGGHTVQEGTRISIDGSNGLVYSGTCIFRVQERYL